MKPMIDPFEPTPAAFHARVEKTLGDLQRGCAPVQRRPMRLAAATLCALLLCGTALALSGFGVRDFLTTRVWQGAPVDDSAIVQPIEQHCDSALLNVSVRDAYWDGETLSVAVHVTPRGEHAFYMETDRGQDGEHFDMIWWDGEIVPYETWKDGREAIMLQLPRMYRDEAAISSAWDWVQEAQGETLLLEGRCDDLAQGGAFSVTLPCVLEETGTTETATLNFTLPPMQRGEGRE